MLQITAPISSGSSGGAVMNSRGEVVGIATSSLQSGQNLNFAVPAAQIRLFIDEFSTLSKSNQPIYVYVSNKVPSSWIAPLSFLYDLENNEKLLPPTNSENNSKLSLEETKRWLMSKLIGRSFVAGKFPNESGYLRKKTERITFNGCEMYVEQKNPSSEGTVVDLYRVKLHSIKGTRIPSLNNSLVALEPSNNIPHIRNIYLNNNFTDKPDSSETDSVDFVFFATDNKDSSEEIEKAFNFIMKSCKE